MAVDQSAYEKAKGKKANPKKPPETETIDADISSDYQAGQALAHRKLQAFDQGYRDEMSKIQDFMHTQYLTSTDTFQVEASYTRSLPSSELKAASTTSFMNLLYGSDDEVTQDV